MGKLLEKLLAKTSIEMKKRLEFMGLSRVLQYFFMQRILRFNADVPWPVHWSSVVVKPENIKLKDWLGYTGYIVYPGYSLGNYIQAFNGIEIGVNVRIGPGVKIVSADHDLNDYDKRSTNPPIKLGDHVWLGSNVVVLPGVELGDHTVVAAGAIVTKSFPDGNCIIGGIPAKVIKQLPDYEQTDETI